MKGYRAALFAPDGEYVTDYAAPTVDDVWDRVNDGGSRWYFYPFAVIVTDRPRGTIGDRQRIVASTADYLGGYEFRGKTLRTFGRFLAANPEWCAAVLS